MSHLILQPTATAQWQALVKEAEKSSHMLLHEDLESYLVFLLVRFTGKPEMAKSVLALEFLHGAQAVGQQQQEELRDVGDKCLLTAGLFPGRAIRKRVRISYFVQLGQNAYAALAVNSKQTLAELYKALEEGFVSLMDVLHVVRELSDDANSLTLLQAEELWQDTASQHALSVLRRGSQGTPIRRIDALVKKWSH